MRFWLSDVRNIEAFVDHHERMLDVWEAAGVNGLVIGPLFFGSAQGLAHSRGAHKYREPHNTRAIFDPNPAYYAAFHAEIPPPPDQDDQELRTRMHKAFQAVGERGWELWLFDPFSGAIVPDINDNAERIVDGRSRASHAARMLDTINAFPDVTGVIIDGPAFGFEIAPVDVEELRHRRRIFELPRSEQACAALGYDLAALTETQTLLEQRLHSLTPAEVRLHAQGGVEGATQLLGVRGFSDWARFRVDALTSFYELMMRAMRDSGEAQVQVAVCPRTPAVASMAGYDYHRISHIADVIMPKFYYWQRGYDGLLGTAWRWARTLRSWNPDLDVRDACLVTRMMFGDPMPIVDSLIEFDRLPTAELMHDMTLHEARRVVAAVGNRARIVPWVDSGRAPHDGDPIPAAQLDAILAGTQEAGINQFTYFNSSNVTPADWTVLSHHCGTQWAPADGASWYPPDEPTR